MRVNFFGGPGSGKSTKTAWLFAELKTRLKSVEHVGEYVKAWAYQDRKIKRYDQIYIFGKQQHYEYRFLSNGVKNVVTDSPCLLSVYYAPPDIADGLIQLNQLYDKDFPCINIFLERNGKPYVKEGRYQNEEEAIEIDTKMWELLNSFYPPNQILKFKFQERETLLEAVLEYID